MAIRFYLLPKIGTGFGVDAYRPAYVSDGGVAGQFGGIDYGKEPWMFVFADVTPAEHTAITAHADATAAPANLDNTIGGNLAILQAAFETANFPADWVTSGMTYRTVLKWVIRACFYMQKYRRLDQAAQKLFSGGITLEATIGSLPDQIRRKLKLAADELGLDTTKVTAATTLRVAIRVLGQQMTVPLSFGGEVL